LIFKTKGARADMVKCQNLKVVSNSGFSNVGISTVRNVRFSWTNVVLVREGGLI